MMDVLTICRPITTFELGDLVAVVPWAESCDAGKRGRIVEVWRGPDGYRPTIFVALDTVPAGPRGLPFAPSDLELTDIGAILPRRLGDHAPTCPMRYGEGDCDMADDALGEQRDARAARLAARG